MTTNSAVRSWVEEMAKLCRPDRIVWCDGSERERAELTARAVAEGALLELDAARLPGCHLHRSDPSDVARTEQCTFICTPTREEAGPTNNWMDPDDAYRKLRGVFDGAMRGRTMYVVPYVMGPVGSPFSKVGVELTDSVYVALNLRIMTRMGDVAWRELGDSDRFVRGLHSLGTLDPHQRYICHFPQDYAVWSVNSGYGGNALLPKKCFALRIAGAMARDEGWLAEHMLIVGVQAPDGEITYVAGAFPSACGKTNLAMLVPPASQPGWKIWTVGDDIAWMRVGPDGRLWAVNAEAGFFGVVPGTSDKTNPTAMRTIDRNTIYTNVALRKDGTVWWEGLPPPPDGEELTDWRGRAWKVGSAEPAAHPNARFTAPASQCPSISPRWEDPQGVPISAILFGTRRSRRVPLVVEARSWAHGVYLGATLASETTAAAAGAVGVVRRDPMAMRPFCGYHMGRYFRHWLDMGARIPRPPRIYRVNWFRRDQQGRFLWPGFGENLRVLRWVCGRVAGRAAAVETPLGAMPAPGALDVSGLDLPPGALDALFEVNVDSWIEAAEAQGELFGELGDDLPAELAGERDALVRRLREWAARGSASA